MCARSHSYTHCSTRRPVSPARGEGGRGEGAAWQGMSEKRSPASSPDEPFLPRPIAPRQPPRKGREAEAGEAGGVGPGRAGGPREPGRALREGPARRLLPGPSAPGEAAGPERVANGLISGLGRWGGAGASLAPPPPWSAPRRGGYKTVPCPGCAPPRPAVPRAGPPPGTTPGPERWVGAGSGGPRRGGLPGRGPSRSLGCA